MDGKYRSTYKMGTQDAFDRLKEMLIAAPILGMPTDAG